MDAPRLDGPDPPPAAPPVPPRPARRVRLILALALAGIGCLVLLFSWMYPSWKATRGFEEPKIVTVRVDDEPFLKVALAPGERYRPIEVMAGTRVDTQCEVVATSPDRRFEFRGFDQAFDNADCVFTVTVPDAVGRFESLRFRYFSGGSGRGVGGRADPNTAASPTDEVEVPVVVVAPGERLGFQGIEDANGRPIRDVSVPDKVRVFGTAILRLPNPKDFAPLFFVTDPSSGRPALVLDPTRPDDPAPLIGRLVRYRRYGQDLDGYALWTPEPVPVGGPGDWRTVHDIYFGLFRKADVPEVFRKSLAVERAGTDTVRVTPLLPDVESLRALTWQGRTLSPPLHVVRAAPAAEVPPPVTPDH